MFAKIFVRDAQFCGHQNIFLPLSFHCEAAQTKKTQVFIVCDDSPSVLQDYPNISLEHIKH